MLRRLFASFLLSAFLALPVASNAASALTSEQKSEVESVVKQYIMDHPEVMISSVEAYYKKQTENTSKQEGSIDTIPAGLYDAPLTPSIGPKDAKVTVVEFFDYNCGYCKQVASDFKRLIDEEKSSVRFIYRELPILSPTSETAASYALAAEKQGKYQAFHDAVMNHQGPISEDYLQATAKEVGLDVEKLKKDATSLDVRDALAKNVELARTLGVRGTPFFLIGKEKVPGAIGYTQMKDKLDRARGVTPSAATTSTTSSVATPDAASGAPAASTSATTTTSTDSVANDPEVQQEIEKARAETKAMIDEIKQQAAELEKQGAAKSGTAAPAKK